MGTGDHGVLVAQVFLVGGRETGLQRFRLFLSFFFEERNFFFLIRKGGFFFRFFVFNRSSRGRIVTVVISLLLLLLLFLVNEDNGRVDLLSLIISYCSRLIG